MPGKLSNTNTRIVDGYNISVSITNNQPISNRSGFIVFGSNGANNTRSIAVNDDGYLFLANSSISVNPVIQPATFTVAATDISTDINKSLFSLVNGSLSTIKVKLQEIYLVNVKTTNDTGISSIFELRRISNHSSGTNISSIESMETTDILNSNISIKTNSIISGESSVLLWRTIFSTDNSGISKSKIDNQDHIFQTMFPIFSKKLESTKPLTLRSGEGFSLKCTTNTTTGLFDIMVIFTQES